MNGGGHFGGAGGLIGSLCDGGHGGGVGHGGGSGHLRGAGLSCVSGGGGGGFGVGLTGFFPGFTGTSGFLPGFGLGSGFFGSSFVGLVGSYVNIDVSVG